MAILTAIAIGAALIGGASVYEGIQSRKQAASAYEDQANEQRKAQSEQTALNFQQQAQERRNQVREERVKRAKLLQGSENGGTADSSGEYGAMGSLATALSSNLGINAGRAQAGANIGGYLQNAADFGLAAQQAVAGAQSWDQIGALAGSIFSASGGGAKVAKLFGT